VYFDDEAAEVVISNIRFGDDHDRYFPCPYNLIIYFRMYILFDVCNIWLMKNMLCRGSLFTNSNWFAFDEDKALNDGPEASLSANLELPSPNVDEDMDEVILGEPIDGTKGLDPLLAASDRDLNEESGHAVLTNGPIDKLEDDIRPPTPDVKESPPESVEWTEEDAEPAEVSVNTAVVNCEAGDEKAMDATGGVMSGTTQLGEEQGSVNLVESSVLQTTVEKISPDSSDASSGGHSEPGDGNSNLECPLAEQKHENNES
jgi:serine/threonine-protein phosphatase 6 regulatory subunit 3